MKVLIIRFSSIGDIVLTSPVVRCLKLQRPDVEVHYLTKRVFADLVQHSPYIDKVHLLDDGLGSILPALEKERFDAVVDLHNNRLQLNRNLVTGRDWVWKDIFMQRIRGCRIMNFSLKKPQNL